MLRKDGSIARADVEQPVYHAGVRDLLLAEEVPIENGAPDHRQRAGRLLGAGR